jgi:NADH:ubiquinone oxidoreductase subunit E
MTETKALINELLDKHGNKRNSLIPILNGIVEKEHFLTKEAMLEVAAQLDISAAEVYGTASFYSFLDTKERGRNVIRICKSITCDMKGKKEIIKTAEEVLKIKLGENSSNKRFSLLETNCLGLCDEGPAMLINDECYTKLTPSSVREILNDLLRNKV